MKVAVLGAGGFVGGHVLRGLRAQGHTVRAIVRRPPTRDLDVEHRIADACDVFTMRHALNGCDYLVHAALGTNQDIVDMVAPVYAAAETVGVKRLVYISTGSVHGQAPAPGTDETSPLSIRHALAYNTAKVRAERKFQRLRARGTVELVVLRPTIVLGPGSRWVYTFADDVMNGTAYVIDGAQGICNSIYVDNLTHAVSVALARKGVDGEIFLLSDAEVTRWRDVFQPIAAAFGVDFDHIPDVHPPNPVPTFRQLYLDPIRTSALGRNVVACLPGLKESVRTTVRFARTAARSLQTTTAPANDDRGVSPRCRSIPPEMIALQRCRWRLPHDKATRVLGYSPPVSFAEGCRRNVDWLIERAAERRAS